MNNMFKKLLVVGGVLYITGCSTTQEPVPIMHSYTYLPSYIDAPDENQYRSKFVAKSSASNAEYVSALYSDLNLCLAREQQLSSIIQVLNDKQREVERLETQSSTGLPTSSHNKGGG